MFVWYHYFAAEEWYNWIRVYIACYVWMTGFGETKIYMHIHGIADTRGRS